MGSGSQRSQAWGEDNIEATGLLWVREEGGQDQEEDCCCLGPVHLLGSLVSPRSPLGCQSQPETCPPPCLKQPAPLLASCFTSSFPIAVIIFPAIITA